MQSYMESRNKWVANKTTHSFSIQIALLFPITSSSPAVKNIRGIPSAACQFSTFRLRRSDTDVGITGRTGTVADGSASGHFGKSTARRERKRRDKGDCNDCYFTFHFDFISIIDICCPICARSHTRSCCSRESSSRSEFQSSCW